MSECRFGSGDIITRDNLHLLANPDCIIEPGAVIRLYYNDENGSQDQTAPSAPEEVATMNEEASGLAPVAQEELPEAIPSVAAAPAPTATVATVGTPDAAIDVATLSKLTGGDSSTTIVLALIAVIFGAAGWKFWQKVSSDHHEFRMKELELKAEAAKGQHQQCATVHAQHEQRLAALESKVTAVESSASGFDADFDPSDVKKRLVKIEKALKAKPKG